METIISYVVAIYNNFTARIDIYFMNQINEIDAIKAALLNNAINNAMPEDHETVISETKEWLDSLPENIDEIKEILVNGELVVTCTKNINQ